MASFTIGNQVSTGGTGDGGGDNGVLISSGNTGTPGGVVLATPGTVTSLSIFVLSGAAGNVLLGIYDNSGTGGQAGSLKASTASTALSNGWNTIPVSTPVLLPAATYWLVFTPDNAGPVFYNSGVAGFVRYLTGQTYTMPATAPTLSNTLPNDYAFYATLSTPDLASPVFWAGL